MSMGLEFDVRLEERRSESVVVSVWLDPLGDLSHIDGVSLQIVGPQGERVSARMVLPIAGQLQQTMVSTLELRPLEDGPGEIPQGSRVVGVVWRDTEQLEASIPTHPFTQLQAHVRALRRAALRPEDETLEPLSPAERADLAALFPWVNEPRIPHHAGELEVVENEPSDEEAFDELVEDLGIDEESAAWLKDLMDEDPAPG